MELVKFLAFSASGMIFLGGGLIYVLTSYFEFVETYLWLIYGR